LANPYIPTDNMAVNPYMALLGGQGGKQATPTGSIEIDYQYGPGNRLLEMTKRNSSGQEELTSFEYDPQGNLLKDGRASYTYDSFNRLQKVETFGGQIQINRYDAEGLRHEIEENNELIQFIYSDRELIVETDTNGELTRYIRGLGIISSDIDKARTYYHYCSDELGSITHILDEEGQILNHYEYDAFGNTTICEEIVSNRFRYTGQQYDKVTEQYYLRARYYNPIIGRFLQEDSYYNDGLNLYAYCENNPVRYIDPSGYTKVDAHDKLNGNQQASMDGLNNPQKKMTWNEFQHANKGKYTKAEMSEAWSDYKKSFDINTPKADVPNSKPTQADAGLGNEGGSQADVLAKNRANGRAFEEAKMPEFSSGVNNAVEQVTIKTNQGTKIRVDAIGIDKNTGNVIINEFKSSATAPLTKNQIKGFPELQKSGGVVVGKGKGIFTGGYQIPPTKVEIIRPNN